MRMGMVYKAQGHSGLRLNVPLREMLRLAGSCAVALVTNYSRKTNSWVSFQTWEMPRTLLRCWTSVETLSAILLKPRGSGYWFISLHNICNEWARTHFLWNAVVRGKNYLKQIVAKLGVAYYQRPMAVFWPALPIGGGGGYRPLPLKSGAFQDKSTGSKPGMGMTQSWIMSRIRIICFSLQLLVDLNRKWGSILSHESIWINALKST